MIGTGTLIFIEPMLSDTVPGANNGNDLFLPEKPVDNRIPCRACPVCGARVGPANSTHVLSVWLTLRRVGNRV